MSLNDIAICSRALIRLGVAPIASFDDGTAESEIAGALYPTVRDAMLSSYGWRFATSQAQLARLSDPPVANFFYAYALPKDFLRALSAGQDGRGRGLEYRISGGTLHSDGDTALLTYIYRPDEADFPPYFMSVLIAKLSAEFCVPLTESASRAEFMHELASSEFARARQIDSQRPDRADEVSRTEQEAVSIDGAKLAVTAAEKAFRKIDAELDEVGKRRSVALDALNAAQRVFDAAVGDIRAQAPDGSSWKLAKEGSA